MATLILTTQEKKSASYLDWDDAALGRAVKKLALEIGNSRGGGVNAAVCTACATMLACMAAEIKCDQINHRTGGSERGARRSRKLDDYCQQELKN